MKFRGVRPVFVRTISDAYIPIVLQIRVERRGVPHPSHSSGDHLPPSSPLP